MKNDNLIKYLERKIELHQNSRDYASNSDMVFDIIEHDAALKAYKEVLQHVMSEMQESS